MSPHHTGRKSAEVCKSCFASVSVIQQLFLRNCYMQDTELATVEPTTGSLTLSEELSATEETKPKYICMFI